MLSCNWLWKTKKKFNISEIDSENPIRTCLNFNKAIFYDSYECISKPVNTFYVSLNNENTDIIKNCNFAYDTCLGKSNEHDTNCRMFKRLL